MSQKDRETERERERFTVDWEEMVWRSGEMEEEDDFEAQDG